MSERWRSVARGLLEEATTLLQDVNTEGEAGYQAGGWSRGLEVRIDRFLRHTEDRSYKELEVENAALLAHAEQAELQTRTERVNRELAEAAWKKRNEDADKFFAWYSHALAERDALRAEVGRLREAAQYVRVVEAELRLRRARGAASKVQDPFHHVMNMSDPIDRELAAAEQELDDALAAFARTEEK